MASSNCVSCVRLHKTYCQRGKHCKRRNDIIFTFVASHVLFKLDWQLSFNVSRLSFVHVTLSCLYLLILVSVSCFVCSSLLDILQTKTIASDKMKRYYTRCIASAIGTRSTVLLSRLMCSLCRACNFELPPFTSLYKRKLLRVFVFGGR